MTDIEIEIDGRKLNAKPNQMLIEVADAAGIYIPRFCYHKHLSIAANCRMCLVEVEKSPKTLPACATPVMAGMKVFTKSPKTIEAQRAVMEFLLINHPLDCPVCDQGGECELQDISMGYGSSWSHYDECKRSVPDEDLGPLIETEMTRCIQCTRCVRFGEEIAGMRELGVTYRGEHEAISTYVAKSMKSEVSGNIIDLCPVGALTSKPCRFTARAWELQQAPSISPHDCVGTNLNVHTRNGVVMRVVSRDNAAINETWIADRDRFSYAGLYHPERVTEPMARIHGKWQNVSWEKALELAAIGIKETIRTHGADQFAALASPNATLEEYYLLQKLVRALGSPHVDHRLREVDTRDQAQISVFPGADFTLGELAQCDAVILIGSNIQKEQPLVALRLRKAIQNGAVILAINPMDYQFNFTLAAKKIVAPHQLGQTVEETLNAISQEKKDDMLASQLIGKQKVAVIVGALANHSNDAAFIRYQAKQLASHLKATFALMTDGANSAGAWLAGAIPHREVAGKTAAVVGLSAYELLSTPRKGYLLLNVEPDLDCANAVKATEAMKQADFVVALAMYETPLLMQEANVILPITPFTETSGTFVNFTGEWQSFNGVATAYENSRPGWKVLRVLANFLELTDFGYESSAEIKKELMTKMDAMRVNKMALEACSSHAKPTLSRIGEIPIYSLDSLVRRSDPLQAAQNSMEGEMNVIRMHPETMEKLGLTHSSEVLVKQENQSVTLRALMDSRVPKEAAWVAGGVFATIGLGDLFGEVTVRKT